MCRWLAYFGNEIRPKTLLYDAKNSLVEQSRQDRLAGMLPNADGFGLGWYGNQDEPGLYKNIAPAWGDRNLRELSGQIQSRLFLGHVRAATGTPIEQTNCHPFRYGRWLFVHNGLIEGYTQMRRELLLQVEPTLFQNIEGTTDSELMFHLALTFGLEDEPLAALERMAGFVEATGHEHGVSEPLQMTVAMSDGERLYAVRYASGPVVNSLFMSTDAECIRMLYPDNERFQQFSDESRAIVSEPLGDLPGVWEEIPPGSALIVQEGEDEFLSFAPHPPQLTSRPTAA